MNINKKLIYNLPDELKLYIVSFIPTKRCLYCHVYVSTVDPLIYCSNYCFMYHHMIILQRISHILFFYFIYQFKFCIILSVNATIILTYMWFIYSLYNILCSIFYCNSLFHNECCSIY